MREEATNKIKIYKGVLNDNYNGIEAKLSDDVINLQRVFDIFNEQFFHNVLDEANIIISPNARTLIKVDKPDNWEKRKSIRVIKINDDKKKNKNDLVIDTEDIEILGTKIQSDTDIIRIIFSDEILQFETKQIYIFLLRAMIMQYDIEMYETKDALKIKWKRFINNNNNYFGKGFYAVCRQRGLVPENMEIALRTEVAKKEKIKHPDLTDEELYERLLSRGKVNMIATEIFDEVYNTNNIEIRFPLIFKYTNKEKQLKKISTKQELSPKNHMRLFQCPKCGLKIRVKKTGAMDIRCYNRNDKGVLCEGACFKEV